MSDPETKVEPGSSTDEQVWQELRRLESYAHQMEEAGAELEHELRRCTDGLERSGGHSRSLEQRRHTLKKNLERLESDLRRNRERRDRLRSQLSPSAI